MPTKVCAWAPPGQQTPCASQNNVGDAEVWGNEVEAEWHPTDALTIDASFSTLDFEYTRIDPGATAVRSDVTPYTPETKSSSACKTRFTLTSGGR